MTMYNIYLLHTLAYIDIGEDLAFEIYGLVFAAYANTAATRLTCLSPPWTALYAAASSINLSWSRTVYARPKESAPGKGSEFLLIAHDTHARRSHASSLLRCALTAFIIVSAASDVASGVLEIQRSHGIRRFSKINLSFFFLRAFENILISVFFHFERKSSTTRLQRLLRSPFRTPLVP
jgi:hypothetical protein